MLSGRIEASPPLSLDKLAADKSSVRSNGVTPGARMEPTDHERGRPNRSGRSYPSLTGHERNRQLKRCGSQRVREPNRGAPRCADKAKYSFGGAERPPLNVPLAGRHCD